MAFEFTKKIKTGLILLVSTGFGLYFGYLVGAALIASAMNPVGAGFLALLLTAMIILALAGTLWALFGREAKGETAFPKISADRDPYARLMKPTDDADAQPQDQNQHRQQFNSMFGQRTERDRYSQGDSDEPTGDNDWMVEYGATPGGSSDTDE